jgi:hypothetical protein
MRQNREEHEYEMLRRKRSGPSDERAMEGVEEVHQDQPTLENNNEERREEELRVEDIDFDDINPYRNMAPPPVENNDVDKPPEEDFDDADLPLDDFEFPDEN